MKFLKWNYYAALYILVVGCSYFTNQDKKASELALQRIDTINWNEVDSFPLFENCNELASKVVQQECFETTFSKYLFEALEGYIFKANQLKSDTLFLNLKIDHEGAIHIIKIDTKQYIASELSDLEKELVKGFSNFPKIFAAQKRVTSNNEVSLVPTATRFIVPIVLESY